jgi:hypothetical protein
MLYTPCRQSPSFLSELSRILRVRLLTRLVMEVTSSVHRRPQFRTTIAKSASSNKYLKPTLPNSALPIFSWHEKSPTTNVIYVRNSDQADLEISKLRGNVLGFDMEWKPTFVRGQPENPVALIQLANQDTILLLQLTAMASM